MRLAVSLLLLLSLIACSEEQGSTRDRRGAKNELVERAQAVIRTGVGFNPAENKIRNVFSVEGGIVCGEINWKDASGNYRGYVPFVYRYGISVIDNNMYRSAKFAQVWQVRCEGRAVTYGDRQPLPEHQRADFAQRLAKLKADGGKETPSPYGGRTHLEKLAQIEQDLDEKQEAEVQEKAQKDNAETAAFAEKMRRAAKK